MRTHLLGYFLVGLLCGLKFVPGAVVCIVCGLDFKTQFIVSLLGGVSGVVFFTYFGDFISKLWFRLRKKKAEPKLVDKPTLAKRIWTKYGLLGAAILTPPVLSPPIGVALALGFKTPKRQILLYYLLSMLVWAFIFAIFGKSIFHLLDILGFKHPDCGILR